MKKLLILLLLFFSTNSYADHSGKPVKLNAHEVKVQVQGVVCSFCAYGAQKSLSKLEFLDANRLNKGVHVDIDNQQITLAEEDGDTFDLKEVYHSIKSGGYEPEIVFLRIYGHQHEEDGGIVIHDHVKNLMFTLSDEDMKRLPGVTFVGDIHFNAGLVEHLKDDTIIPAFLDKIVEEEGVEL